MRKRGNSLIIFSGGEGMTFGATNQACAEFVFLIQTLADAHAAEGSPKSRNDQFIWPAP